MFLRVFFSNVLCFLFFCGAFCPVAFASGGTKTSTQEQQACARRTAEDALAKLLGCTSKNDVKVVFDGCVDKEAVSKKLCGKSNEAAGGAAIEYFAFLFWSDSVKSLWRGSTADVEKVELQESGEWLIKVVMCPQGKEKFVIVCRLSPRLLIFDIDVDGMSALRLLATQVSSFASQEKKQFRALSHEEKAKCVIGAVKQILSKP